MPYFNYERAAARATFEVCTAICGYKLVPVATRNVMDNGKGFRRYVRRPVDCELAVRDGKVVYD